MSLSQAGQAVSVWLEVSDLSRDSRIPSGCGKVGNPLLLGSRERKFKSCHPDMVSLFRQTVKCNGCGLYDPENRMTVIPEKGVYHTHRWDSPRGYTESCYEKAKNEK